VIKRLLATDGVSAVCRFRDDGAFVEGYGALSDDELGALARFAHDYKRIVQGNADQLSMFTGITGWTPPAGWIVRGVSMSVCSVGNLVCIVGNQDADLTGIMATLAEASRF
jgi:roadblock/LC7 domain-containing protein